MATDASALGSWVARTELGPVRGFEKDGVVRHLGVPYAAPPTGDLRFRSPQPHPGWNGTLDATAHGPPASQSGIGPSDPPIGAEDCLRLDITAPASRPGRPMPVAVWFHGGGFVAGRAIEEHTRPDAWCRRGIIVVAVTYRLGALGWLRLASGGDDLGDGNLGLQDQIAALDWVRRNIGSFGGDPDRVTVVGQSAGAMSVAGLMGAPAADGLFHGAILQSGAADHTVSVTEADHVADRLAATAGVTHAVDLVELPVTRLLDAQRRLIATWNRSGEPPRADRFLTFAPVAGTPTVPLHPIDALREGRAAVVPMIVGANSDEMRIMTAPTTETSGRAWLAAVGADSEVWADYTRRAGPDPTAVVAKIRTDLLFRLPALRLASAVSRAGGRAWHYDFAWSPPSSPFGACHSIELRFVFGTVGDPEASGLMAGAPPNLERFVLGAWTAMVASGNPDHEPSIDIPAWSPYLHDGPTFSLAEDISQVEGLRSELRQIWGDDLAPP